MGDARRFDEFAKLVERHLAKDMKIVDVAAGKGYLRAAMYQRGYRNVTCWDKRPRCAKPRSGYRYGYFDYKTAPQYDAVVAMHPDEGTDQVVLYAVTRGILAIVCPCCAKPSASTFWGSKSSYGDWTAHLEVLARKHGADVAWEKLPINGRNRVMIIRP